MPEGTLGPEYEHRSWDGIERRGKQHEIRLWKIEKDVGEIKDQLEEHGVMLKEIGNSFNPLIHVLEALTDWARIFTTWMGFVRFCMRRDVRLFVMMVLLAVYYVRTGDWQTVLKAVVGG